MKPLIASVPIALAFAAPVAAQAAPMTDAKEIELALEAAPAHLRAGAGLHLLGPEGYRRQRESSNGFECLVEREADGTIAPICFDAVGAASLLPAVLLRARLAAAGTAAAEIETRIAKEFYEGRLTAPQRPGVAYMLSPNFKRIDPGGGAADCVFPPHVMVYVPYRRNSDFGIPPSDRGSQTRPWVLNEGKPEAYLIVTDHSVQTKC